MLSSFGRYKAIASHLTLALVVVLVPCTHAFLASPRFAAVPKAIALSESRKAVSRTCMAAPPEALSDIVIPNIEDTTDERLWVPQTECLSFRPLCLCVSQGYYVNLLRFRGGGVLGTHRHSSPVHAMTLKGKWGYKEHGWEAGPGSYVFEPPGEVHTLHVSEECDEMIALFHVTGSLLYVDEATGQITGFDDVFSKLAKAKAWYEECGLGADFADQFVR